MDFWTSCASRSLLIVPLAFHELFIAIVQSRAVEFNISINFHKNELLSRRMKRGEKEWGKRYWPMKWRAKGGRRGGRECRPRLMRVIEMQRRSIYQEPERYFPRWLHQLTRPEKSNFHPKPCDRSEWFLVKNNFKNSNSEREFEMKRNFGLRMLQIDVCLNLYCHIEKFVMPMFLVLSMEILLESPNPRWKYVIYEY